ncbi:MAG: N-acetyl sugar amidotransferase [Nitrospirae bacterium]|nr:MAG: N-acetyl sugar amidotransferase [Nitrospirota bacterium]
MRHYQVCTRCVMDTGAKDITFDDDGVCNYCTDFLRLSGRFFRKEASLRRHELDVFISKVKADAKGKRYDCVLGVSGGVDSSWALVQAVKHGLRPLAVHMDNGWNSELAQNNIANLVRALGVDLYTHVIEWGEYQRLMQAFFDADVIDVELLYDNAMRAVNYRQAAKYGIKCILSGSNDATEGMRMPEEWNWFKLDVRNIRAIGRQFGGVRLDTFPYMGTLAYIWYSFIRGIRWVPFLNYFEYNKFAASDTLQGEYGFKPYPYKHYESVFTRFYQGYILPNKFGVDKRRLHLSSLIVSGQMDREEALKVLEGIPYPSDKDVENDKRYFIKKMGWTMAQLSEYISRSEKSHLTYPSEKPMWDWIVSHTKPLRSGK